MASMKMTTTLDFLSQLFDIHIVIFFRHWFGNHLASMIFLICYECHSIKYGIEAGMLRPIMYLVMYLVRYIVYCYCV